MLANSDVRSGYRWYGWLSIGFTLVYDARVELDDDGIANDVAEEAGGVFAFALGDGGAVFLGGHGGGSVRECVCLLEVVMRRTEGE